jgi:cob(I)alamin adenosyltransferase
VKIYTRTGDDGTTSLSGGKRVSKNSARVEAYGSVDELIAWIGLLRSLPENNRREELIIYIQDQLMKCAAHLSSEYRRGENIGLLPDADCTAVLEREIDKMDGELPELRNFILPGGNILVSYCHIARCVCRRAERCVNKLNEAEETAEIVNKFLNRLSDYLFVLSRKVALELDIEQIKWPL